MGWLASPDSPKKTTSHYLGVKAVDVVSVAANPALDKSGTLVTITIGPESYEVFCATHATTDFSVKGSKTRIYTTLLPDTLETPRLAGGTTGEISYGR